MTIRTMVEFGFALALFVMGATQATFSQVSVLTPPACNAQIESITVRGPTTYAPLKPGASERAIEIRLADAQSCTLTLALKTASGRTSLSGPGGTLDYRLLNGRGLLVDSDRIVRAETFLTDKNDNTELLIIRASIPAGQLVPPGSYRDTLMVQVLTDNRVLDQGDIALEANVLAQAKIGFAAHRLGHFSSRNKVIDFGSLETGEIGEAKIYVLSNSGYTLEFKSAHQGRMRRLGPTPSFVPYKAKLNGRVLDLSQDVTYKPRGDVRQPRPDPFHLSVQIGDTSRSFAGHYRDIITATVFLID